MQREGHFPASSRSSELVAHLPNGAPLTIRLYPRDGWSVIEIDGELDIQGVPSVRRLRRRAGPRVLFDLRQVTFIDCSGLRAIVGDAPDGSGPTRSALVCGTNARARRLLEIIGWDRRLLFFESLDEAVRAGAGPV